ncbi:MAG: GNAT family N-acetyltransferase [Promethearchaeota archaeon]|nr:MAG: GNAT family N-acetyltransferase [Candidatus Lokiarchaeota archaeon]
MPESSRMDLKKKRIRSFFTRLDVEPDTLEEEEEMTLTYVQMRLPVEDITPEFEEKVKAKVKKNFLNAKIREASEEDLPSVCQIHNRAWLTANEPFRPIEIDSLEKIFEYPETEILIARVYGQDGGFIILDFEQEGTIGIIAGLGVLPRFQRKGLGTVLGVSAWNYFKEKNVEELRCEVYEDNQASYDFIKSLGFQDYEKKTYTKDDFIMDR